jgi:hypothetical protein
MTPDLMLVDISVSPRKEKHVTFQSSLTVQSYARQLNILSNRTATLGVYLILKPIGQVGSSLIGISREKKGIKIG